MAIRNRSIFYVLFFACLHNSLSTADSSAGVAVTAMRLPYGFPILLILIQKFEMSTPIGSFKSTTSRPNFKTIYVNRSWWNANSTEHNALIPGRVWNAWENGSRSFIFDITSIRQYTFPCEQYDHEENVFEWNSWMLELWIPCTNNESVQNDFSVHAELFPVKDNECPFKKASITCVIPARSILHIDLRNLDTQCIDDIGMPEDWIQWPPVPKMNASVGSVGYRILKLHPRSHVDLGLGDPRVYTRLGLRIGWIGNSTDHEVDLMRKYQPYLRFRVKSDRCRVPCEKIMDGNRSVCRVKTHCTKECGLECDFENMKQCPWTFEPPESEGGFRRVSGKEKNGKSGHYAFAQVTKDEEVTVKIVSPFLQRTASTCKMRFQYRLHGMPQTDIFVFLEPIPELRKETYEVKKIEAKNAMNAKWTEDMAVIGAIHHPMRIRLEAWLNNKKRQQQNFSTEAYIDGISLVDCEEELYYSDTCQRGRTSEKYRCDLNKICIEWDQLCDMQPDCFDGEDENDRLHNCTNVPLGARCTFEDGMCGWVNSSQADLRWIRTNGTAQDILDRESNNKGPIYDHTLKNASGQFMYVIHKLGDVSVTHAFLTSPRFPRMSKSIKDPNSPLFEKCRVRFFFRTFSPKTSYWTLSLSAIPADGVRQRRSLWESEKQTPSVAENIEISKWIRASVVIPYQEWEYQLQMSVVDLGLMYGHVGIDDISMTPQCFIEDDSMMESKKASSYNFTSCGMSGARGPNQSQCDAAYNNTETRVKLVAQDLKEREFRLKGFQTWRVPMTGAYRIVVAGAAGGSVWGDETMKNAQDKNAIHNYGTEMEAVFNFEKNDQLVMGVGQRGESPCQAYKRDPYRSMRFHNKGQLLNGLCSANLATLKLENGTFNARVGKRRLRRHRRRLHRQAAVTTNGKRQYFNLNWPIDPADLPGAGGGGASFVVNLSGTPLIIAAGGGGIYFGSMSNDDGSAGGNGLADKNTPAVSGQISMLENMTIAGGGIGLKSFDQGTPKVGGTCRRLGTSDAQWSFEGGFGGGGASCGPGGGGGGGYAGGSGGNFSHGHGGWSYSIQINAVVRENKNPGSGYIRIYPCLKQCPNGSVCHFLRSLETCQCLDGSVWNATTKECEKPLTPSPRGPTTSPHPSMNDNYLLFIVIIVALVAASVVAVVAYLVYRHKCGRKQKMDKYKRYNTGPMLGAGGIPMHQFPGGNNFHAEFNPNYEMFSSGALQDLKEIPRQCVALIKALGQGAFGEVYEGLLSDCNGETNNLPIAVKSLPEFATEQAQMDFHMEALIMSKFNHPNIVRFIGVCFEKMPRFIILELLAGGDLKTFLRENRPKPGVITKLAMADLLNMALDVAHGCQYLEENHFIHRDIAARNCLLTTKGEDRVVKIADFGMARDIYRADYYRKGGKAMLPVKWMPPEAFLDGIFTTKTDVWSFGVLLWEIFSLGYMPYPGRGNQEVMQLVTAGGRLEAPTGCPAQIYQIMTQCWHTIAEQRPKFSTIIERLGYCIQDPDVVNTPLPALARSGGSYNNAADTSLMQSSVNSGCFALTSPTSALSNTLVDGSHCSSGSNSAATIKRSPYSMSNSMCVSFHAPEPMPTQGNGVNTGVCAPYQPQSSDTFLPLHTSPKQSAGSASDCVTDVLLVQSTAPTSDSGRPQDLIPDDKSRMLSIVQPSSSTCCSSSSLLHQNSSTHDTPLDDDVFVVGGMNNQSSNLALRT